MTCPNDDLNLQRRCVYPPAVALALIAEPPPNIVRLGVDAFIVDSGSGQHLVRRSAVASEKHLTHCSEGILLHTAKGIVRSHLNENFHQAPWDLNRRVGAEQ